ncbi:transcription-repair coupling factor [Pleionea litopenaei]|uniref:Transcription-repair-coupling factor n=1 Tax=Pleionea litopenaei TaxID=3070815 RepID=A0AA51RUU6_9GAMM|nr:transcription-repair coupling factor [Pleionea sp. HL-JVS1]WMS88022.1 transcription-repair coupling factor [Pleionea sp. HL-JVS1]
MPLSLNFPSLVTKPGFTNYLGKLPGSSSALVLAELINSYDGVILVLCEGSAQAQQLERALDAFYGEADHSRPVVTFPDWETLPYDRFSAHESIVSERLHALHQIAQMQHGLVIAALPATISRIAKPDFILGNLFKFQVGAKMDLSAARNIFEQAGYRCVEKVLEHGEFAVRGSLLDIFPMGNHLPIRVDFFDDEIETIRSFDPETQMSVDALDKFELLPAHEFPTDDAAITHFRQQFRSTFDVELKDCQLYQDVSNGLLPAGIEYYLPLFSEQTVSLLDYLPESTLVVTESNLQSTLNKQWESLEERYEEYRWDRTRPILAPEQISFSPEQFNQQLKRFPHLTFNGDGKTNTPTLPFLPVDDITINHKAKDPISGLRTLVNGSQNRIVICAEGPGRREAISDLLKRFEHTVTVIDSWREAIEKPSGLYLTIAPIEGSFSHPDVTLIAESSLFGQHVLQRRRRQQKDYSPDTLIHSLAELNIGAPVVHADHGVGRYLGLECITANNQPAEYLTLEYASGDKLYVPVQSLHLIHRYTGASDEQAPLHKLGNEQWAKERKKAAEKVRDVAAELLDLYAKRAAKTGFQYQTDNAEYLQFADGFPFELTDDQESSVNAILQDMQATTPMDRLVCGDVGFGKTEVAMRAAFIAVQNTRQVAVLVPTTLLAQQHFENFKDRFADWPFRIEVLSRFRTAKETEAVIADIQAGKVDIVIGTHKLLQGNVEFSDLGLVIIDEEHRFGVRQKEKLKAIRAEVDVLTLTATPIPRTLNMSLSGMRDLSIIATPPARRLAIKTFVREYNKPLIKEAIQRETLRGGQVYFLHNSVDSIERRAAELRELMPELNIAVAHGQMRERELEQVMQQFYHRKFHILVCTTIIETGIDVPNANTIIMDRADKLGLAQLHQLRGRVGRSHHQAYAYLMVPSIKGLSRDAKKRLDAISSLEDLGAGFSLATHDMEIRGAGEILGDDQSGQMESVGFSMYMEMLEQAVTALKEGREPSLSESLATQTEVEIGLPALIPEDYIPDVHTRLTLYKRLASCKTESSLRDLQVEMIDRFGLLPDHLKNLIKLTELKQQLTPLGITKLIATDKGLTVDFNPDTVVNPQVIISLIQRNPSRYRLEKGTILKVLRDLTEATARWSEIETLIATLGGQR